MRRRTLVIAFAVLLAACSPGAREAEPFEGIWQSEGWGTYLYVAGGDVEILEYTAGHCLSVAVGGARGIGEVLSFEGDRLVMRDADREIRFDRIELLPLACAGGQADDAASAVAIVADTIEEQYVGDLDPEWPAWRADVEGRAADPGADVGALLIDLIEPFDGRVRLGAGDTIWPPPPEPSGPEDAVEGGFGGYLTATIGDIAYLGLTRTGPFDGRAEESERVAGRIADDLTLARGAIIDLRASTGGVIADALVIASRFVPSARPVGSMLARSGTGVVPAGDLTVTPIPTGAFAGPVAVLIGPETRGLAELLAALLSSVDTVTLVGAPTAGDPGPPLIRSLPNGWSFAVPNLVVLGPDGSPLGSVEPDVPSTDPLADALRLLG